MDLVDLTPLQLALVIFEAAALIGGTVLLVHGLYTQYHKNGDAIVGRLGYWSIDGAEVILLLMVIFVLFAFGQGVMIYALKGLIEKSPDKAGLAVALGGLGAHGAALLGWPLFAGIRRRMFTDYNIEPPPAAPSAPKSGWPPVLRKGALAFLVSFPLVSLVSFAWVNLLQRFGLPNEPQDMLSIFNGTKSAAIYAGLTFVACIVAPANEELFFRRGIFHFCRQRFGRGIALVLSAGLFGASHANLAAFLPLATLGVILALAYERTGDIRVPIIAHALFNLNTIIEVLAGLSG